jgi:hypothetical protein
MDYKAVQKTSVITSKKPVLVIAIIMIVSVFGAAFVYLN